MGMCPSGGPLTQKHRGLLDWLWSTELWTNLCLFHPPERSRAATANPYLDQRWWSLIMLTLSVLWWPLFQCSLCLSKVHSFIPLSLVLGQNINPPHYKQQSNGIWGKEISDVSLELQLAEQLSHTGEQESIYSWMAACPFMCTCPLKYLALDG